MLCKSDDLWFYGHSLFSFLFLFKVITTIMNFNECHCNIVVLCCNESKADGILNCVDSAVYCFRCYANRPVLISAKSLVSLPCSIQWWARVCLSLRPSRKSSWLVSYRSEGRVARTRSDIYANCTLLLFVSPMRLMSLMFFFSFLITLLLTYNDNAITIGINSVYRRRNISL